MTAVDGPSRPLPDRPGITRRNFMRSCAVITAALALPLRYTERIAEALTAPGRPPVLWLEFQDCAGDSESFLRSSHPTPAQVILDLVSLNYHETLMAPAGEAAEKSLHDTMENFKGKYLLVVEGSIPTADRGVYCLVAGKTATQTLAEAAAGAAAVIAVGTCAAFGGLAAAAPNPTGALGVRDLVKNKPVMNLPGCPVNAVNLSAALAHFLTFGALPAMDEEGRPLFAYSQIIHDNCPRRSHFDAGRFVAEWGDEGHRKGWCLFRMGCKGPAAHSNCPQVGWNDNTSWPIAAGHPCMACTEPGFWDTATPLYRWMGQTKLLAASPGRPQPAAQIALSAGGAALAAGAGVALMQRQKRLAKAAEAGPADGHKEG